MTKWWIFGIVMVLSVTMLVLFHRPKVEGFGEFKDSQMAFANKQSTYFHDTVAKGVFLNPGLNLSLFNQAVAQPDLYLPKSLDRDYTTFLQVDPENAYTDKDRQFCRTAKHPRDFPPRVKGSMVGCGWYFVAEPSIPSVGVLGTQQAPLFKENLPQNGEWIYDLAIATMKEDIKICKRVKSCALMDVDGIKGVCGFCERLGYAVPIQTNGTEKYPESPDGSCGEATLNSSAECDKPVVPSVTTPEGVSCGSYGHPSGDNSIRLYTQEECTTLGGNFAGNGECLKSQGGSYSWDCRALNTPLSVSSPSTNICTANSQGKLSRECLMSLATGIGMNKSGAILRLLGSSNSPTSTDTQAIQILQSAGITVPNAVLGGGDIDAHSAGNIYNRVYGAISSGQNEAIKQAARYMSVGGDFDPCSGGSVSTTCLQQAFRKAGCQPSGNAFPSEATSGKYGTIEEATSAFQTLYTQMKSTDSATQDLAMKQCLGTSYYRDPPPTCDKSPQYLGCFNDCQGGRAIPNNRSWNMQSGDKLKECEALAKQAGDNVFGLQYYKECWSGKDPAYDRMGAAQNCPPNGGGCTQQVYKIGGSSSTPGYQGCFKDNGSRMIPKFHGNVSKKEDCFAKAKQAGDNVVGLQYGGQCFTGNNSRYDALGKETNTGNCGPLGGSWSNQVYTLD